MARTTYMRLPDGHWHIRGSGPCNWAQPPYWPCPEATLRASAFPEAGETFLRDILATQAHLYSWLDRSRDPDEQAESLKKILLALSDDPELIDRGLSWPEIESRGASV